MVPLEYDPVGRVTKKILPDLREIDFTYDDSGNLATIQPPGQPLHTFDYTATEQTKVYDPPGVADVATPSTHYQYNLDRQLTQITRPDGQAITYTYDDAKGRLNQVAIPRGVYDYSYNAQTGQVTQITDPQGGALNFQYDGPLAKRTEWSGDVFGSLGWIYDGDFRIQRQTISDSWSVSFAYDDDGLLTSAGAMSLTRDAANGLLTNTALGNVTTTHQHNAFGEPVANTATISSNDAVQMHYTRDKLGRITSKTEVVNGHTIEDSYEYDLAGRLVSMTRNGQTTTWGYDENGNRADENGQPIASHDEQDRLVSYAGASYEYTANGELKSKAESGVTTTYNYDELGNLLKVTLPGDVVIDYLIDGRNRRIGKKVNGTLTQGFLYQDQLNPIAELDGSGNVVSRFVYADKINVPAYMIRDGKTYRIISDHLGSPRLVIDSQSGEVAQRIEYDVWGNIAEDTNPGFQPFGFAGGIYDQHTGLVRFGARDYDPVTARWTAKDPILFGGRDTNLYAYVSTDPVNFVDLTGRAKVCTRPLSFLPGQAGTINHTLIQYNDGSTVGLYPGEGQQVREDTGYTGSYECSTKQYDDQSVKDAVEQARPQWEGNYSFAGGGNCQNFVTDILNRVDPPRDTRRGRRRSR